MAEVFVYHRTLDGALFDGHPAELRLCAVDGKGNDTHHGLWRVVKVLKGSMGWLVDWRVAEALESATEQFVNFPISLLAFGAAVVDVLAAGAELARLGTDSTLVVGGCHDGANFETSGDCRLLGWAVDDRGHRVRPIYAGAEGGCTKARPKHEIGRDL